MYALIQTEEDKDDDPSKYLECVVNEDSSRSAPSPVASGVDATQESVSTEPSHMETPQVESSPKNQGDMHVLFNFLSFSLKNIC